MSNVVLELDEIMELLLEAKVKGSMEDTACRWVRDNRERWQQWIASETSCTEGHGLVSLNGAFVRNRSQAWMKNGANTIIERIFGPLTGSWKDTNLYSYCNFFFSNSNSQAQNMDLGCSEMKMYLVIARNLDKESYTKKSIYV